LTTPVVGDVANDKLVDLHTSIFLNKADEDRREERRAHLDSFFDATMDTYVAALEAGFPEAEARDHPRAGQLRLLQPRVDGDDGDPGDELEPHYRRYESFFGDHGITIDDPLGEFRPAEGIVEATETPENLRRRSTRTRWPASPTTCTSRPTTGTVVGGETEEPEEVDPSAAPGLDEDEASA